MQLERCSKPKTLTTGVTCYRRLKRLGMDSTGLFLFRPVCARRNHLQKTTAFWASPFAKTQHSQGHNGECDCDRPCPFVFRPVCSSDGITYNNDCLLDIAICQDPTLFKEHNGECDNCDRPCPLVFQPVCGSDGITYESDCLLDIAICRDPRLFKEHNGGCDCDRPCPFVFRPVCSSDGITYNNDCLLDNAICQDPTLFKEHNGECGDIALDSPLPFDHDLNLALECPLLDAPVCGSDGVTYPSECFLELAVAQNPEIFKVGDGDCRCYEECDPQLSPICGTDGVTYGNQCLFESAQCHDSDLRKVADVSCECYQPCPPRHPVCGSVVTYRKECVGDGECETRSCRKVWTAVLNLFGFCKV
ncbi:ovoinhibitor-like [Penaeus monodon]|uniref:ovoinhibitor-like n=1 Tax=Penaeus monodon TaxID=6687 RepID=UPI0018A7C95B|nr:ovoinhibitor-like [Penaeus monodon]